MTSSYVLDLKCIYMQIINMDPNDIRICQAEGETLTTIVIPREKLDNAKKLPEIPTRGIYYLLDEDYGLIKRVYVGQTTQGIARLDNHRSKKQFWNKAILFLTSDRDMSQDILNGLEAQAIEYVKEHGSYETENRAIPNPYISPYSKASINRLHASILFMMATLGYHLNRTYEAKSQKIIFHTKRRGIYAEGFYDETTKHFTVLAGSQIDLSKSYPKAPKSEDMRKQCFSYHQPINQVSGHLLPSEELQAPAIQAPAILDRDVEFSSPSAAGGFVLGQSINGWTEWVDEEGRTLSDVYRTN